MVFFPLNLFFKSVGGIPVERDKKIYLPINWPKNLTNTKNFNLQ